MFKKNKDSELLKNQIADLNRSLNDLVAENLSLKSEIIDLKKTIELMKLVRNENGN